MPFSLLCSLVTFVVGQAQQQPLVENNLHSLSTRTTRLNTQSNCNSDELQGRMMNLMKKKRSSENPAPPSGRPINGTDQLGEYFRYTSESSSSTSTASSPANLLLDLDLDLDLDIVLGSRDDCYDGVLIDPKRLPLDPQEFVTRLRASIGHWRTQVQVNVSHT